jgi:hypothetical protein
MVLFILHVRNIFKILGCHERYDTTQKSIGQAKLSSAEGAHQKVWAGSPQGFYLTPCCSAPAPGLGRFWAHSLHGWLIRKGPGLEEGLGRKKFKSSGKQ